MNDDCNKKGNKSCNKVNSNYSKVSNNMVSPNHIHNKYLQIGDILFQDLDSSPLCDAIEKVTRWTRVYTTSESKIRKIFITRSFKAMLISIIVVVLGVIWSFGFIDLFDYKITLLTALVPPVLIVIGIPNCIFLINKFHNEYHLHQALWWKNIIDLQRFIQT